MSGPCLEANFSPDTSPATTVPTSDIRMQTRQGTGSICSFLVPTASPFKSRRQRSIFLREKQDSVNTGDTEASWQEPADSNMRREILTGKPHLLLGLRMRLTSTAGQTLPSRAPFVA